MVVISDTTFILCNPFAQKSTTVLLPHQVSSPSSDYLSVNFLTWSLRSLLPTRPSILISPISSLPLNCSLFILTSVFRALPLLGTPFWSLLCPQDLSNSPDSAQCHPSWILILCPAFHVWFGSKILLFSVISWGILFLYMISFERKIEVVSCSNFFLALKC